MFWNEQISFDPEIFGNTLKKEQFYKERMEFYSRLFPEGISIFQLKCNYAIY